MGQVLHRSVTTAEAIRRAINATYPIGFLPIDLAEVRTAEGELHLFVAIDRTSKFAVVELVERADM